MYACYFDESGHCGRKYNAEQPVEVLAGVITDVTKLFKSQRDHSRILAILTEHSIPLEELKASDAYGGRGAWKGVDPEIRDLIFEFILGWLGERWMKVIVTPVDSKSFFDAKDNGDAMAGILSFPWEAGAVHGLLALQRLQQTKKRNKGKTLLVYDEQEGHHDNLLRILSGDLSFTDGYTGYKPKPRAKEQPIRMSEIMDVPYYSKSHLAVMIQFADWVAFIVSRYLQMRVYGQAERYAGEREKISEWYRQIGRVRVSHTCLQPRSDDDLTHFLLGLRPNGWTYKDWEVA